MRRWAAGAEHNVSGIRFRVVEGAKEAGDLRIEWATPGGWRAIEMAAAFLLVDFFVENEEHLRQFRTHWRESGADYFFRFLHDAVEQGWQAPVATLRGQQAALRPAPVSMAWCRAVAPDGTQVCTKPKGHEWAHGGPSQIWPQSVAS